MNTQQEASDTDDDTEIEHMDVIHFSDKTIYLVGHPEDFLDDRVMNIMKKAHWHKRVNRIVVDEAHCVVEWGKDFRPQYRNIDNIRSIFTTSKPSFTAVTAAATTQLQQEIARILNLKNVYTVTGEINRRYIKLSVHGRPGHNTKNCSAEDSYTAVFMPFLHELKASRQNFPKTVIYTILKWCGFGNELSVKVLENGNIKSTGVKEISQYHAPLPEQVIFT